MCVFSLQIARPEDAVTVPLVAVDLLVKVEPRNAFPRVQQQPQRKVQQQPQRVQQQQQQLQRELITAMMVV